MNHPSSKPYLIRAIYDWITDSGLTPYLAVRTNTSGCVVPPEHITNNRIVLNISGPVVHALLLGNDAIEFKARFSGVPKQLYIPIAAVESIYAKESGEGMAFPEENTAHDEGGDHPPKRGKPDLKIVK